MLLLGEYQIAQAFSNALVNKFSIGTSPITIPANLPVRPISVPPNVVAASSPQGITVTWDEVYGVMGYDLQYEISGVGVWESVYLTANRYDTALVLDGWTISFKVRASNSATAKSDVSLPRNFVLLLHEPTSFLHFSSALDSVEHILTVSTVVVCRGFSSLSSTDTSWTDKCNYVSYINWC